MKIKIIEPKELTLLLFTHFILLSSNIKSQVVHDTLYLFPDTTTFYNQTPIVVEDISNLAVMFSVDSNWGNYQIEKILAVIPSGLDTTGFEYYQISVGEVPQDSIIYTKMVFNHPTFPEAQEIAVDPPINISGFTSFYISGIFNVSVSNFVQGGIHDIYAYWWSSQTWVDYFPVYFNLKVVVKKNMTIVEEDIVSQKDFILYQNYPNPFNPSTIIKYDLKISGFISIKIYDLLGREVKTLVNEEKQAGYYEAEFDASNLSSNVYLYRISINDFVKTIKMLMVK